MLLPNPDFLEWLLDKIRNAKETIVIVNYIAALIEDDKQLPVAQIVYELIAAVKRGIQVQVVLEGSNLKNNYCFWRILKNAGADIWLDTSATFIHTKAVLIDGCMLSIGSHNITDAALSWHEEMSFVTSDRGSIDRFRKELEKYTSQRHELGDTPKKGVHLPVSVIDPLVKIKRSRAPRTYMLYLLLCRLDGGKPKPITINIDEWVEMLGMKMGKVSAYKRIKPLIDFMDCNLGIVRFNSREKTLERRALARCKENILLPDAFWDFSWHKRLSVEAIHFYFAGEAEKLTSPYMPWWRLTRYQVAKKYSFHNYKVSLASRELMKYDLMEVLFETSTSIYQRYIRHMNYFRENPFYDYNERMKRIKGISKHYSKSIFLIAQKIADKLNCDMSVDKIDALCRYASESGENRARRVLKTLSALSSHSSKLTFDYAQELFEKKGVL